MKQLSSRKSAEHAVEREAGERRVQPYVIQREEPPASTEALAAGDLHNLLLLRYRSAFDGKGDPRPAVVHLLQLAKSLGHLSAHEERHLLRLVEALHEDKPDFGLGEATEIRTRLVEGGSGDLAIAASSIAVSSTGFWLRDLGTGDQPQQARRKRLWTALADLGGGILGFLIGGAAGASAGGAIASAFVAQVLPAD